MSELNKLIKELCPDGVEFKPLGEIATIIRGPFGSSLKKECFVDSGYAVYEQQHAIYSILSFRYYIDDEKFKELKKFEVKPDDLIISCSGTIGKVMIIPENAPQGIINQALLKLTPHKNIISKFLKYCFENTISKIFNDKAHGGAIKNVPSVSELKQIKIPVPPLEVQNEIVRILDKFTEMIELLKRETELRQKQYEYYRDKLLNFEVKK